MLVESIFDHADKMPDHLAVIDDSGSYTQAQLAAMVAGLGIYLSSQTSNRSIGLLLPAGVGFVASFYGTLLAGKTVVPINFLLGEREINHIIADSGIDTVVTIPLLAGKLKDTPLKVVDLTTLPKVPPALKPPIPQVSSEDLAVVMYTSGTSGLPKGVMLSYGNLQSDVTAAIDHAKLQGKHNFLGILPLFHSTGMLSMMLAPIVLGATVIYIARFSPVATMKAIRSHNISIIAAVPSMYAALARLKDSTPDDVKCLYAAISGGEPLPSNVRDAFEQKYKIPICEGYGLTETIGPIAFNAPGSLRAGSVGQLIPTAKLKITDEAGNALPQGQTGEIWLSGPMVMKGYLNLPKETAEALTPDGYFKSGDLGHLDSDGYLYVTGRKKDLIIVAGEKAAPREIEEVLMKSPAVADVAVVGKKDPSRGEVVVAFVIPKEGQTIVPDELKELCRANGMPQWKIPREIFIEKDLPRSPTGKVLKRLLADRVNQA